MTLTSEECPGLSPTESGFFQPTQRQQRKERNEMTSLLDRLITDAGDDGVCRWQAAKSSGRHARNY